MSVKSVIGPGEGTVRWLMYNFMLIYWCVYIGGGMVFYVRVNGENAYWALFLVTMSQVGVLLYSIWVTCFPSFDRVIRRTPRGYKEDPRATPAATGVQNDYIDS